MENSNKFEGISIKLPKAKIMKSKHSLEYKHGDASKKFLNPLRDWMQSDRVKNMRQQGYIIGVGGKKEEYEDTTNQFMNTIESLVITFYLYKPKSQPYKQPSYQQGQSYSQPVPQQKQVIQEEDDPMDDKIPEVEQAPF